MVLLTALTVRRLDPSFSTCQGGQDPLDWKGECPRPGSPRRRRRGQGRGLHLRQPWEPPSTGPSAVHGGRLLGRGRVGSEGNRQDPTQHGGSSPEALIKPNLYTLRESFSHEIRKPESVWFSG